MDPSYKSFINWKQCRSGVNFIKNQDVSEINKIQNPNPPPKSAIPYKSSTSYQNFPNSRRNQQLQNQKRTISFQIISTEFIDLTCDFNIPTNLINIIKEFQGRYNRESKSWTLPYRNYNGIYKAIKELKNENYTLIPISLLPIDFLCQPLKLSQLKFASSVNTKEKKTTFIIDYTNDPVHSIFELPSHMLSSLYNFQKAGIEFGVKKSGRLLLADEMGVGKTIQAIGISAIFKEDWPVLILCPSSLKFAWRDEIRNWLGEIITKKEVQVFKTSKDNFKEKVKYYIISYDLSVRIIDKIIEKHFNFMIADEAHYLKNKESKRSKYLTPLLQRCKRLILLSGTPILAKPVEAYPLLNALRPDVFHSFKEFGTRYCNPIARPFGIDWSGSSNSRELHFMLSRLMIRRLKKDVLSELPPKKRQKVEIQTDKKIINQIRVLMNKSKINLEDDKTLKELQILDEDDSSKNQDDDNNLGCFTKAYMLTGKAKIPGIKEYVTYLIDNSCKFLIFAHHTDVLDAIEEVVQKAKIDYMRIDGKVSNEKRHERVSHFQSDDNCLVAILGITACATGLTLTKASTVVFAELHFTPAIMIQAEDRAHRIGQEHQCVNVHYLYASDTVDEVVFTKLREKHFVVSTTLDNKALDMGVQKIKEKVGDFVKINGKEGNQKENKEGVYLDSARNKTLNDFVKITKTINLHNESDIKKRSLGEITHNINNSQDKEEDENQHWEKLFHI